jgi:hypothetical protein
MANPTTSSGHARTLKKGIAKAVRSFLGFMQYFSRFIPRFSDMASHLYDQTKDELGLTAAPELGRVWLHACLVLL